MAVVSVLNFMIGIPFGASYFPVEWQASGKEALGLRMFLFSTAMAQLTFTYASKFKDGVGLQMVENVPFCLELARIVMGEVGCGKEGSSTLFFLFGGCSVLVGGVFYGLGRLALGRVVYFFPSHVLVGCIGGIGAFIITTCEILFVELAVFLLLCSSMHRSLMFAVRFYVHNACTHNHTRAALEVSTNTTFHFTAEGVRDCILQHFHLLAPVLAFEILLRILITL